jgi:hypothetical protein
MRWREEPSRRDPRAREKTMNTKTRELIGTKTTSNTLFRPSSNAALRPSMVLKTADMRVGKHTDMLL